jgi:opacity protein-like surface antigen
MRNWKILVAAAAVTLAFSAGDADAQVRLSLAGGPSFPLGSDNHLEMGYHAQLGAELGVPLLPFGVRVDGAFNRFNEDHGHYDVLAGTANAILRVPMIGFSPYLIGGVGMYGAKDEAHGNERETNFGFNVGAGANFALPGLGIFVEARLHNPTGGEQIRFVPVSLGFRF